MRLRMLKPYVGNGRQAIKQLCRRVLYRACRLLYTLIAFSEPSLQLGNITLIIIATGYNSATTLPSEISIGPIIKLPPTLRLHTARPACHVHDMIVLGYLNEHLIQSCSSS